MKKILGLTVALIAVIAMLGTGTWAYFNDVANTTDNTITAGKLYMTGAGVVNTPIAIQKVKPGDDGSLFGGPIVNSGDILGDLYFKVTNYTEEENTWVAGRPEDKAGDLATNGGVDGELGSKLRIALWVDGDSSGFWDNAADYYFKADASTQAYAGSESHATYGGEAPDAAYIQGNTLLTAIVAAGELTLGTDLDTGDGVGLYADYFFVKHAGSHFTIDSDNVAQDDGIEFDLGIALVQANE